MRHSSHDLFASPQLRLHHVVELVTGRATGTELAARYAEARERTRESSARSVRQNDRPAGRMTLLAAE